MKIRAALLALVVMVAVGVGQSQATINPASLTLTDSSAYVYVDPSGPTVYYSPNGGNLTVEVNDTTDSAPLTVDFPSLFGVDPVPGTATSHAYTWASSDTDLGGTKSVDLADAGFDLRTHLFTLTKDTTAPTGQSVALSGGPGFGTLSVPLVLANGSDAGSGVDTSSGVVERASATLSGGTCGTFGSYASVTLVGGADTSVASGNCYRYRYRISDRVGNESAPSADSANALVSSSVPTVTDTAPTEVSGGGDQYWNSSTDTLWFRPAGAGSFTLNATATDSSSSITKVDFPDVSAVAGWSGSTGGTDTSSPYASPVTYTWTAGAASPGPKQVIATNSIGVTGSDTITIGADSTPPTGQTVVLGGGPWYKTTSVPLTLAQGTDTGAGVDSTRTVVERASATLTNGACGTFGLFAAVTLSGATDTSVASGNCYRYQYKAADLVGNVSTASPVSADARVDTTAPTVPTLRFTGFSNAASSGNVVYYRPSGSGVFTVTAASSDGESGLASYSFPTVAGVTAAGSGPSRTYRYTNPTAVPSTPLAVTATNGVGLTSAPASFTLAPDGKPPTLTVRCNGKPCVARTYPKAVTITATATDGTGSGVGMIHYTTNGTTPTADTGAEYVRAFALTTVTRLKVRAYDKAGNPSKLVALTIRSAADRLAITAPRRLAVKANARYVFVRVTSTRRGIATATMRGPRLKRPHRWKFILDAGTSIVQLRLPTGLSRPGRYTISWAVRAGTKKTSKTTRIALAGTKAKPKTKPKS